MYSSNTYYSTSVSHRSPKLGICHTYIQGSASLGYIREMYTIENEEIIDISLYSLFRDTYTTSHNYYINIEVLYNIEVLIVYVHKIYMVRVNGSKNDNRRGNRRNIISLILFE